MSNVKFIICRKANQESEINYKTYLEPSLQKLQVQVFQAITQEGKPEESVTKKYNAILQALNERNLFDDRDILVFCEEDVNIVDNYFMEKINMVFDQKPNVSIVGVLGTTEINQNVEWWMNNQDKLRGHILQNTGEGSNKAQHLIKGQIGFHENVVAIDRCIMMVRASVIKNIKFDEDICQDELFNIDFCVQALQQGHSIAVADILVYKNGMPKNNENDPVWNETKTKLLKKWMEKGLQIPITTGSFNFERKEVMEIEL
jgi:hypothetical protein